MKAAVFFYFYQLFLYVAYYPLVYYFISKKRLRRDTLERRKKQRFVPTDVLFHVASIGEFNGVRPLIERLLKQRPDMHITVSCITDSAFEVIKDSGLVQQVLYLPVDFYGKYKKMFSVLQPKKVILTETEYWYGFLYFLVRRNIPFVYVNARLTDFNQRFYFLLRNVLKPLLAQAETIFAAGELNFERLKETFALDNVRRGYSFKYLQEKKGTTAELRLSRERLGINAEDKVLIFGSLHQDELVLLREEILRLCEQGYRIILAPRHIKNLEWYQEQLAPCSALKLSEVLDNSGNSGWQVLIVDRFGVLKDLYALGTVAVVGGSFDTVGGHNIIEPIEHGCPVFFGPDIHNFAEEAAIVQRYYRAQILAEELEAVITTADFEKLREYLPQILSDIEPSEDFVQEVIDTICSRT